MFLAAFFSLLHVRAAFLRIIEKLRDEFGLSAFA